ncbi:SDR family oxidoreductase [Saccharopolyspora taberi]|uniref:NAD(P)H-binding protein n=1 Tax=Saccharopolyspora taberi TaxID=60895 RepID=A0ABN3V672_9PSEU
MIAITGATGTVGRYLLDELAARRVRPRALVRDARGAAAVAGQADPVLADFEQPETLRPALEGVRTLFLLTPLHPRQGALQQRVIDAAVRAGVSAVVKVSALGIGTATGVIHEEHEVAEHALEQSGLSHVMLRCNGFMQNSRQWLPVIARFGAIRMPVGDARVSWIDARDIAAVAAEVLTGEIQGKARYDLTGPAALSYPEVARILSDAVGVPVGFEDVPEEEARKGMLASGAPEWAVRARLQLYATYRQGLAEEVSPAVAELTGREARDFAGYAPALAAPLARLS